MNLSRMIGFLTLIAAMNVGIAARSEPVVLKGHSKAVSSLIWAADGLAVATASDDRTIRIWDPVTGRQTATLPGIAREGYGGPVVAFTSDLKIVAVNYWGQITIRNVDDGKERLKIDPIHKFKMKPEVEQGEWASAGDVAFAPDGRRIAAPVTAGSKGTPAGLLIDDTGASIKIWDLETGKSTQPVKGLSASVGSVVFSPDGKRLATAGADKSVRVWDVQSGTELAALPNPDRVVVVAFKPDGKSLAAGSKDGSVRIWDLPATK